MNTALRRGLADAERQMTLGELASRSFVMVRDTTIAFDVIRRIWARNAVMAVVVRAGVAVPRGKDILGVITKEHVADSVADSVAGYRDE